MPCGPAWQVKLGEDAYHKVSQRLLDLLCTDSTPEEKQSALFVLNWPEDSSAEPFLKAALNLPNVKSKPTLRMAIVTDLLHWKDLSVLSLAEEDLFNQSVQSSGHALRRSADWRSSSRSKAVSKRRDTVLCGEIHESRQWRAAQLGFTSNCMK
jgi:hypothetical protein